MRVEWGEKKCLFINKIFRFGIVFAYRGIAVGAKGNTLTI